MATSRGAGLYERGLTVGIDIGGTKVAAGVVNPAGRVLARGRAETPHRSKSPKVVEDTIAGLVEELRREFPVKAVGVGAAGFVDEQRARVQFAPHLAWREEPLRDALKTRLGLPVVVENDANASAWAEVCVGAGQDASEVVVVNLGTGIGGAVIIGGRLQRGRYGIAGEFGHMTVVPGGRRCECGNRGCWEQYASGNAVTREARELAAAESPVVAGLIQAAGEDRTMITGPLIGELAAAGDRACVELLEETGSWLGIGLANLAAAFDPELFIIGGGVSACGDLLLGPARTAFERNLTGRGYRPLARVELAALNNDAGMIGAADLARETLPRWRQGRRQRRLPQPRLHRNTRRRP